MKTTKLIGALLLVLFALSGCAREDPRIAREKRMSDERSRGPAQTEQLRERITGQAQR